MNDTDHLFALPELEQHKLDEVKEEIVHPVARRLRRFLAGNAWTAIAISATAGLVCGLVWRSRG
jgi:ElaB/YqjD/DUF883 family membrane-anchored ribosome-binding protein